MSKPTKVPGIPKPSGMANDMHLLTSLIEAVEIRLGRRGDPVDRAITLRELIDSGLAKALKAAPWDPNNPNAGNLGFSVNEIVDTAIPPVPTNFSVAPAYSQNILSWDYPRYSNHSFSEIYGHDSDVIGDAQLIGVSTGRVYIDPVGSGVARYYWIRHVSQSSVLGPFNSGTGTLGQTALNTAMLLAELEASIPAVAFAAGLEPISVVNALPAVSGYTGPSIVLLTTDGKLYRFVNGAWTAAVPTVDLTGTIASLQIADDAVTNAKIAVDAIQGDVIAAGAITETTIAADAVTNAKIAIDAVRANVIEAGAITSAKIAADAITATKLADDAVTNAKIAVDAIQANVIEAGAITETKIGNSAITTAKIDANAITSAKIDAGAVTATEIASNAITSAKIDAGAVTASEIASNAITAVKINAGAITANKIATDAVTADSIEAGAITAGAIAAGAIDASNIIVSGTIVGSNIAADAITAAKIQAGAIGASEIAAGVITGAKIAANTIAASRLKIDTNVLAEASNGDLILATGSSTKGIKFENLSNDAVGVIGQGLQSGNLPMANQTYYPASFTASTPWSEYTRTAVYGTGTVTDTMPQILSLDLSAATLQESGSYYLDYGAQPFGSIPSTSSTSASTVVLDIYRRTPGSSTYIYVTSRITNNTKNGALPLTTRVGRGVITLSKTYDYQFRLHGLIRGFGASSDGTMGMYQGFVRVIRIHKST